MTDDLVVWLRVQLDIDERGIREWVRPPVDWLLTSSLRPGWAPDPPLAG